MEPGTALTSAQSLADELEEMEAIQSVSVTPADTALEDFRESSGLGEALDSLGSNPLPHTLVVRPGDSAGADELQDIETQISENDDVDMVKIDTAWVERLNAILDFLRRIVLMASLLLIAAVVIIVGNTIRLDIQNHRDEIEVLKLLGASDGSLRWVVVRTDRQLYRITGPVHGRMDTVRTVAAPDRPVQHGNKPAGYGLGHRAGRFRRRDSLRLGRRLDGRGTPSFCNTAKIGLYLTY